MHIAEELIDAAREVVEDASHGILYRRSKKPHKYPCIDMAYILKLSKALDAYYASQGGDCV